ncbi:hypothetical protein PQC34_gp022 [Cronobacter phage A24]|uniref:Uncharacterized protein n=1 Tax=Cronobacter phage A24 TaxID=2795745 RepID=A0A7T5QXS1_9CAUD|nr:hypothetical protein PQC34_gp022 [Cronobacter phage A24]QQG33712.1 hypothetical protein [Cronobacter phage A24]
MFGSGRRANGISKGRVGHTSIRRPSTGTETPFGELRAGDFFTHGGRLYLKTNLVDAVEIPDGSTAMVGTNQFSEDFRVQVENVVIHIQ